MQKNHSFRNLTVWQRSMTLVEEIYRVSKRFPREELLGLTAQVRSFTISTLRSGRKVRRTFSSRILHGLITSMQPAA
jgi:hypothetical protein